MLVKQDEGWAWFALFGVASWNFLIGGLFRSYGLLYIEFQNLFPNTPAEIGLIATICGVSATIISPIAGFLTDRFSSKYQVVLGSICCSVGLILTSFSHSLIEAVVGFGIIFGSAISLIDVPVLSCLNTYFHKYKNFAGGIAFMGTSVGSLISGHFVVQTISCYTVRGTLLIFGGIFLNICIVGWIIDPTRYNDKSSKKEKDDYSNRTPLSSLFTNVEFIAVELIFGCGMFSFWTSIIILPVFMNHIGFTSNEIAWCITAVSIGEIFTRSLLTWLVDYFKVDISIFLAITYFITGMGTILFIIFQTHYIVIIAYAAILGGFGGLTSAFLNGLLSENVSRDCIGFAVGLAMMMVQISVSLPTLIAGYLFQLTGTYIIMYYIVIAVYGLGAMTLLFYKYFLKTRKKLSPEHTYVIT